MGELQTSIQRDPNLKYDFPTVPILLLTATAPPQSQTKLKGMLRNPVVSKASINCPNIELRVERVPKISKHPYQDFAKRVKEIVGKESGIIYTDFVNDVRPILCALRSLGFEAVGYYGEMDVRAKSESYAKWRSGTAQLMVATKAFGMGINRKDVRHIIRNGVPESISSWAQELGRGGRDGLPATATILYSMEDLGNAKAWIKDHLRNYTVRDQILADYSEVWRYVLSHTAGQCRRKTLLTLFGEDEAQCIEYDGKCCDVCENGDTQTTDYSEELFALTSSLDTLGAVGEVKVSEWIRGSNASWTNNFDKSSPSYGSGRSHSQTWWRNFMRACHVLGYVQRQLKSIIKHSGHYAIQPVYVPTALARSFLSKESALMLPVTSSLDASASSSHNHSTTSSEDLSDSHIGTSTLKKRVGKGSHLLTTVRHLLNASAIPSLPVTKTEAAWTDKKCNWSVAEHWASWWSKPEHLKMLCAPFADMSAETWELCPATTNAVERKNAECKENQPLPLKVALANMYKLDKAVCFKHIASLKGISITYPSKTAESRANEAVRRKEEQNKRSHHDPDAQYGPPDKKSSFESKSALKDLTSTGKGKSTGNEIR